MSNQLSERIAALRKERGLTQEQLGQLVGVSAQAVSKWEKGGAPDVELLPTLADRLGVTIDGLFGRDNGPAEDMTQRLRHWLSAIPEGQQLTALYHLLAANFLFPCAPLQSSTEVLNTMINSSCYQNIPSPAAEPVWLRSYLCFDEGLALAVLAQDFPLYLLLPEPPEGYEVHFAPNSVYRQLFSALSQEGSLEILRYLYGQETNYYTCPAVAKRTDLPLPVVEQAMAAMEGCHLLNRRSMELEDGCVDAFVLHDTRAFLPFLYFARWFATPGDAWCAAWDVRERPILATCPPKKENDHEANPQRP